MPKEKSKAGESDLLQRAIKYCWGDSFLNVFRAYFRKHAHHFLDTAEEKTEEHSLVYQELFQVPYLDHRCITWSESQSAYMVH
jgi:hypothetical protein